MVIYLSGYIHDDIGKKYKYDMSNVGERLGTRE